MAAESATKLEVFVRLCNGNEDCRELGFRIPDGLSQGALLDYGFGIDGHTAVLSVTSSYRHGDYVPLADALGEVQRALVAWLAEQGYEASFR